MNIRSLLLFVLLTVFMDGCADMDIPQTKNILKDPMGEGSLVLGMSKTKVKGIYGTPDMVSTVVSADWNKPREEWVYRAAYSSLPVGAGYLSEDLYLYFDGNSLTNVSREPLGKIEEEDNVN